MLKRIDRLKLIDKIGRELQSRMTYADIDIYLSGFNINMKKGISSVNSKWVYTKALLSDAADEIIIKIAQELEIKHEICPRNIDLSDSKFWLSNHFRLFISHISQIKDKASALQEVLKKYYISAFVAHEDIAPTREWQDEILKALFSMDALIAILTDKFNQSNWTDQEIGVAVGRDVLVIPIRKGLDPYGFIAKYQGLNGNTKTVAQVADALFEIIANHPKTQDRISDIIINQILLSKDEESSIGKLLLLKRCNLSPEKHLGKLRENILNEKHLLQYSSFICDLSQLLKERGMDGIKEDGSRFPMASNDDIPF